MPTSDGAKPPSQTEESVSRFVRTLDVYPVAPPHKTHGTTVHPRARAGVSAMACGDHTSPQQPEHARGPSCSFHSARTPYSNGRAPGAATAAGASSSTLVSVPKETVTEAEYRLSPHEVQRRAQQVLTAQIRSLLEARLQERLHQARVAHAQLEATRRPPPAVSAVLAFDNHMASTQPNRTSSEAAYGASAAFVSAKVEPLSEEVSPLITTAMATHGGCSGSASTRPDVAAAASAVPSPMETSIIDVHPYSAVELVRVHRLKGVPNHNRGLFAGLSRRYFRTRSGHYTVGGDAESHGRVRSGVSGFMWKKRRKSGAASGPPPRLTMRSLFVDNRLLFQWTESDSLYAVQEEDEFSSQHNDGTLYLDDSDVDDAVLGHSLKRMLERTYGKRMTAEQRAEAARRLRERREGQEGTSGRRYRRRKGKDNDSTLDSLTGGDAMTDADDSFLADVKDGFSGISKTGRRRQAPVGKGSRHGSASRNAKHSVIFVEDFSPVEFLCDSDMPPLVDTPMSSSGATLQKPDGPLLNLAVPRHRYSLSTDGSSVRYPGGGEPMNTTLLAMLSVSSLGHTLTADEAEAHRRKRHLHVGFENSSTGSRLRSSGGPAESIDAKSSDRRTLSGHGTYGSLSLPSCEEQRIRLSQTDCLYTDEGMPFVGRRLTVDAGGVQGMMPGESAVPLRARGDTRRSISDRAEEAFTSEETQQRLSATDVEASISATVTSQEDSMSHLKDSGGSGDLDEFLIHFPEEENHVRLRRAAKSILDGVEDMLDGNEISHNSFLLPRFLSLNLNFSGFDDLVGGSDGADDDSAHGDGSADDEHESLTGFGINDTELNEKFRIEAEEEFGDLVAQRDALLAEVEAQRQLLENMGADVHYLSIGQARTGVTAEQYAIMLTSEVSRYANLNHLRLNASLEEICEQYQKDDEEARAVERAAYGFLDRFGRERTARAEVGCQVCDADLCYVDAAVHSTEEQLEDWFSYEKALVNAVRLSTVAVANIMTFHASLEMESTCHECFFVFDKPRTLWPCGHTFCLPCLSNMYNRRGELICSECGSFCEVGYTPNISVELIANYQTLCKRSESDQASEPDSSVNEEGKMQTIEGVLRSLLNNLLASQSNWTATSSERPTVKLGVNA
ncbi:hypothetical protein, conserved [Leishmania tarentolae]|uniref:RING-type domain-containing protein n=1 Tax=Leishmania tarentolae TaxID=5689 RepID=A0A640KI17_LEITA|nr:hypothetical protein, conserved [Leishmania tarentolae]